MRRRKRILFLYVLFLCVAYINKSIYIYIYELAVEFCIFESNNINNNNFNNNIKKNLLDGFITPLCSGTSQEFTD